MQTENLKIADKFFELCESGQGWEACSDYCTPDSLFRSAVLPMKTLKEYTNWMQGIIRGIAPDGSFKLISRTSNENQVVYCATFTGTHSLDNGPGFSIYFFSQFIWIVVKPHNPPKKADSDYCYIIELKDGKIVGMVKIWDQMNAFLGWGWPLPTGN